MPRRVPEGFLTQIDKIAANGLLGRLQIGIQQMELIPAEKQRLTELSSDAVNHYWHGTDHGLAHSRKVSNRIQVCLKQCPNIYRMGLNQLSSEIGLEAVLMWSAILHDIGRFFGPGHNDCFQHQEFGARLAYGCFRYCSFGSDLEALDLCIQRHDYMSPIVDHEPLPELFLVNPLAEFFRLVDKTSNSPSEEIQRYYETGVRLNETFFKPELTDEFRFSFDHERIREWDMLNYFLVFLSLQPSDFHYGETRDLYRQWEAGKLDAVLKIFDLAEESGCTQSDIDKMMGIIGRFVDKFNLPVIDFDYIGMYMV